MSWRPRGDERQRLTGCTWCDDDGDYDHGDYDHDNDGDDDGNDVNEQEMQEKC